MTNSFINDIAMEMMMSQEGKDKIGYVALATEAMTNPDTQAAMVQKLYKETQKIDSVDFGRIPDSKGDVTKYQYYDQMYDCITLLNNLSEGNQTTNLVAMNKLHQILLDARQDFVFGFKTDNYLIISTYKCMVMNLYEMINICVVDATAYLRQKASIKMNRKIEGQIRETTKNVNRFIKMYESGQWSTLMKTFKSGLSANFAVESTVATEADATPGGGVTVTASFDPITPVQNIAGGIKAIGKGIPKVLDATKNLWTSSPAWLKVAGIVIALLAIIRLSVYSFIHGAANIKDSIKTNSEILKASLANGSNTVDGVESQRKLLDKLQNVSDTIEYKILRSEKETAAEVKKADRESFNPTEIRNISGSDFEF